MDQIPHTRQLPIAHAPPASHPRPAPEFLREHLPGNAAAEDKQNAGETRAIGDARPSAFRPTRWSWQERFNKIPQRIGKQCRGHTRSRYFADEDQVSAVLLHAVRITNGIDAQETFTCIDQWRQKRLVGSKFKPMPLGHVIGRHFDARVNLAGAAASFDDDADVRLDRFEYGLAAQLVVHACELNVPPEKAYGVEQCATNQNGATGFRAVRCDPKPVAIPRVRRFWVGPPVNPQSQGTKLYGRPPVRFELPQ